MRRILAVLVTLAALAAGCGEDEPTTETGSSTTETPAPKDLASTDVEDVEVAGAEGEEPTLTFDMPFGVEESVTRVLTEGDGDAIEPGSVALFDFVIVNGRDGTVLGSSFDAEPQSLVIEESLMPGIFNGLNGVTAGSRVLIAMSPADGGGADEASGVLDTDTLLFFAEVHEVRIPLSRAEGAAVAPVDGHPTVTLADDGTPTITLPGGEPPTALIAQPLIEGKGAVVESGQTITVHYTGVLWDTGAVFDSSWERGAAASFGIGTGAVIPGWDEGLVGRRVGSQLLLVVPPDKGYGETGSGETIPPGATLVFVVDILDAG